MKAEEKVSKTALGHGVWLAVCDSAKALLLQNKGDHVYPNFETREFMAAPARPTHELGTDQPGRAFSAIDGRRSSMEETDFHLQAERQFIQKFADRVEQEMRGQEAPVLVLIAPARALGILRDSLGPCAGRAIAGSLTRDYVHMPLYEIERHLAELQLHQ